MSLRCGSRCEGRRYVVQGAGVCAVFVMVPHCGFGYGVQLLLHPCGAQKQAPSLRSLLREPVFVMQAAEHGSLHHAVPDRQPVSVLVGLDMVRHGLWQTGA